MKYLLVLVSILFSMNSFARDKMDGCGLGWEVTDGKTLSATSTRATTNNFVPPTFGMTSGTLGCDQFDGIAMNEKDSAEYVAQNYSSIRAELAMGHGEYVSATAQYLNCETSQFAQHMQNNYDRVVASAKDGIELYQSLKAESLQVCKERI